MNTSGPERAYLYIKQLAEVTPWSQDQIRQMICRGMFKEGVHFFRPAGGRPVFCWKAVRDFIEGKLGGNPSADAILRETHALLN
jgi:hypothetical protein